MRHFSRSLVLLLLFTGMTPVAAAQTNTPQDLGAAAAIPDPREVATEVRVGARADSRIASAVAALLLRQPTLTGVGVEVHAGIVTLRGKVPEDADRSRAATLAKQVNGVIDVVNTIVLDASLRTRFNSALDQVRGKLIRIVAAAPLLVVAIVIVLLAWWLGHLVASRPARWLRKHTHNPYMEGLIRRIVQALIVLLGLLMALNLLGATALVGAVLGSAGVIGLALGFAFKDVAENYIAGVLMSLRRPFAPGDLLVIGEYEGKVVALTSRTTYLITLDGNHLSLPNALVFKSVILNYSANSTRRFNFSVPIDPSCSIRDAQRLALAEIATVEGVLGDPAPSWIAEGFIGSGITLKFYGWIDQLESDINKVRSEALRAVKSAFASAGIESPRSVQYVFTAPTPSTADVDLALKAAAFEPTGGGDTSVNHDIDPQLAAAREATEDKNLLDTKATPGDGDIAARTP